MQVWKEWASDREVRGVGFPGALESLEASRLSLLRRFLALPWPQSIRHLPPPFTRGRRHSPRPQILDAGSDLWIPDSYFVFEIRFVDG
ncbi:hypothetical protein KSP40_PGU004562 [Platanthera guangdongensis]|uniref:Uncharacterized protein n=1 Tax=Platanthera guangdongensis TaxID=2320717 RepID=A0ABR2MWL4_9ASPA